MHAILVAVDPLTVTVIAHLIEAPQPSVTRCVQRLEAMRFVERIPGRGKLRYLVATPKGQELLQ